MQAGQANGEALSSEDEEQVEVTEKQRYHLTGSGEPALLCALQCFLKGAVAQVLRQP